jgi:L-lactate dehydrogenase complex protein LldE
MACDKAAAAAATGASRVLSTDGGCLLNVNGALEAKGASAKVQHIAEFLWERTHAR